MAEDRQGLSLGRSLLLWLASYLVVAIGGANFPAELIAYRLPM